jgi:hypothetical protein
MRHLTSVILNILLLLQRDLSRTFDISLYTGNKAQVMAFLYVFQRLLPWKHNSAPKQTVSDNGGTVNEIFGPRDGTNMDSHFPAFCP